MFLGGDFERAADWCFSHEPTDEMESENSNSEADNANLDGPGDYELVGIISHIGKNTSSGHYVAHIKKNGQWIFFNDEKVILVSLTLIYLFLFFLTCTFEGLCVKESSIKSWLPLSIPKKSIKFKFVDNKTNILSIQTSYSFIYYTNQQFLQHLPNFHYLYIDNYY
jgi:hypothetical protein